MDNPPLPPRRSATLPFGGPTNPVVGLRHAHGLGGPRSRGVGLERARRGTWHRGAGRRAGWVQHGTGWFRPTYATLDDVVQEPGWSGMVGHERSLA